MPVEDFGIEQSHSLLVDTLASSFSPPPQLTVSEWADTYRYLSPESSASPGRFQTATTEYARGVMDVFNDPAVDGVVLMFSSQTGKSTVLENLIAYHVHLDPCPMLLVFPKEEDAREFSRKRLQPLFRDTPALHGKLIEARSRSQGSTVLSKQFEGGSLALVGANSPSNLAMRPVRKVIGDEVDRFPPSAGEEGDPVSLAIKRTTAFWNSQWVLTSSPTIKGLSRIEAAFNQSDQRFFFVPCRECGQFQRLSWEHVKWYEREPETAHYECQHCKSAWDDVDRIKAVRAGHWEASEDFAGVVGFHLNEIYSPFVRLEETVRNFLEAKQSRSLELMRVWTNTALGEPWDMEGTHVDDLALQERLEAYPAEVPAGACLLTAAADVQQDRIECEVVAWGPGYESWSIDYHILFGDPAAPKVWHDLDRILGREYEHESGIPLRISCAAVDSGYLTQTVYNYCRQRSAKRIHAIKGKSGFGEPIAPRRPSLNNRARTPLYHVGVDTAKEMVVSQLNLETPGPGYCHFPRKGAYTSEYFSQLAAEKIVRRATKGVVRREWRKVRERNEALDLRAYNLCALHILNPDLEKIAHKLRERAEKVSEELPRGDSPETPEAQDQEEPPAAAAQREEQIVRSLSRRRRSRRARSGSFASQILGDL